MKVLVTGGRTYGSFKPIDACTKEEAFRIESKNLYEQAFLDGALATIHAVNPITKLIHGAAAGADSIADEWGYYAGVNVAAYPANWGQYGKKAGPLRNIEMLDKENPDLVVAFTGGVGTAHMVENAKKRGIKVLDLRDKNGEGNQSSV